MVLSLITQVIDNIKPSHLIDVAAIATVVGSISNYFPPVSALLSIIWLSIQIGIQLDKWIELRRQRKKV